MSHLVRDPVCHMEVDPSQPKGGKHRHKDSDYYFCSTHCLNKFKNDPELYLSPDASAMKSASKSTGLSATGFYICPMDPEVRANRPGSCPKCGMALEPEMPLSADELPAELVDFRAKLFWSAPLAFLTMVLAMVPALHFQGAEYLQALLSGPVVFLAGWPFLERAWHSFQNRHLNMFSLIGVGTISAYTLSCVALIFKDHLPEAVLHEGHAPLYFESAAVITCLVLLGQVLELRARHSTQESLRALISLGAKSARQVLDSGEEIDTPIELIAVGTKLRIRPGEKIPVDGDVLEGESSVNESMITGEFVPVEKKLGDSLTAGTLNESGQLLMSARRVGKDTLLARMIQLVQQAQRSQAPIQRLADRVAAVFVPTVLVLAALTLLAWGFWGPEPRWLFAIVNAMSVLVVACPCALGLATPMAVTVGTGRAAQLGVLFKNATALETLATVDTLVFDKTGTLTSGQPTLKTVQSLDAKISELALLQRVASLERSSEHPFARAVLDSAAQKKLELLPVEQFRAHSGLGVQGIVGGRKVLMGTAALLKQAAVPLGPIESLTHQLVRDGQMVALVAMEQKVVGLLSVFDPIRPGAKETLKELEQLGLKLLMCTGDQKGSAALVAESLGLAEFRAEVQPQMKLEVVQELKAQGRRVAMVGDGINDAPALAAADVGVAMGTGTDVAIETAGVTLLKGNLKGLTQAVQLSRLTLRNVRQNLWFAFIYNTLGIPIAMGVLYPWFGWLLSPMIASFAMSLSSVSVIANSLRLRSALAPRIK